jgi:hypothetical protein
VVRKGSPVRVRQSASKTALRRGFLLFGAAPLTLPATSAREGVKDGRRQACAAVRWTLERFPFSVKVPTRYTPGATPSRDTSADSRALGLRSASSASPTIRPAAPWVIVADGCGCGHASTRRRGEQWWPWPSGVRQPWEPRAPCSGIGAANVTRCIRHCTGCKRARSASVSRPEQARVRRVLRRSLRSRCSCAWAPGWTRSRRMRCAHVVAQDCAAGSVSGGVGVDERRAARLGAGARARPTRGVERLLDGRSRGRGACSEVAPDEHDLDSFR